MNLFKLKQWGVQVPPFGVVTTVAFDQWQKSSKLDSNLLADIRNRARSWNTPYFAVRSSMTAEDGETSSFAGVMETFLYVKEPELEERIIDCFKSAFSERAIDYSKKRSEDAGIKAAVVVQAMIPSVVSGVAFSRAPQGNSSLIYIDSGYGLGEGIVSGLVEVDSFWVTRFLEVHKSQIQNKEKQVAYVADRHATEVVSVPESLRNLQSLSDSQIKELSREVLRVEAELGRPADIEWAFDQQGHLHLLQVRPITQMFEPLVYYSDTNLSESYPALTSPMTADFVKKMYTKVISEIGIYLGLGKSRMAELGPYFDSLISEFGGHMYYNLNSYYTVLSVLPGGQKAIDDWHRMIGGQKISVPLPKLKPFSRFEKLTMLARFAWIVLWHTNIFRDFCTSSEKRILVLENETQTATNSKVLSEFLFVAIDRLKGWGWTALNDILVMSGLRKVTKSLQRFGYGEEAVSGLLRTKKGVDSMQALVELKKLCSAIKENTDFWLALGKLLDSGNPKDELKNAYSNLLAQGFAREVRLIEKYLDNFGDRAFEELKLECMTFKQSPRAFLGLMRWMVKSDLGDRVYEEEKALDLTRMGLLARLKLKVVMGFTERTIQTREKTRMLRGQYYGWVRRTILKIGELLKQEHPSLFSDFTSLDFFSLEFSDLKKYADGQISAAEVRSLIDLRKGWPETKFAYPENFCHPENSKVPPYFFDEDKAEEVKLDGDSLSGTGASPGVIRAKALVLKTPQEAMAFDDLKSYILITQTTDPAWIFILSQCCGLVSEKGSLLSHTAIIGRELKTPTVVGVRGATKMFQTGEMIEIDGEKGLVRRCQ
ncbi:MAG: hypothetical protein IT289_01620 [Oligoflexia bacterium]|nr:hypothetical protein [Oligoflexia bacterium]